MQQCAQVRPPLPHLESDLLSLANPLNVYVEGAIAGAERSLQEGLGTACTCTHIRYSHRTSPGELVGMQLLAQEARLAYKSRQFLSIHREFGPWFALRAAIVVDGVTYDEPQGCELPRPYGDESDAAMQCALDEALKPPPQEAVPSVGSQPSSSSEGSARAPAPVPASTGSASTRLPGDIACPLPAWHRWLALRDACPLGRGRGTAVADAAGAGVGTEAAGGEPADKHDSTALAES